MEKERMNWRSFADQGAIVRQWNFPSTPTFYIIDPKGRIHQKWVGHPGEKAMEHALMALINKAKK